MKPLKLLLYVERTRASQRAIQFVAPLISSGHARATIITDEADQQAAVELLASTAATLTGTAPEDQVARPGRLESVLIAEAQERKADLVVLAPPKRTAWQRWLRGSQAASLAKNLPTSMLLVRGRPVATTLKRALIAAGGGSSVLDDAELAAQMLAPVQGEAVICHVISQMPMVFGLESTHEELTQRFLDEPTREAANLRAAVELLRKAGVETSFKLRVGTVLDEVLDELRDSDYGMLVIGTHQAASMLDRLLLQDFSADLLIKSPVPVLLVCPTTPSTPVSETSAHLAAQ